jgi:hypothetical protein
MVISGLLASLRTYLAAFPLSYSTPADPDPEALPPELRVSAS